MTRTSRAPAPIFFHRSVPGFVIQSGGYISAQDPFTPPKMLPGPVTTFSPIPNEARPDLHNVRGTIAMAKLSDRPEQRDQPMVHQSGRQQRAAEQSRHH